MRIIALSDWRVQNIQRLIEYIQEMAVKPDFIVYAGDDIERFNSLPDKERPHIERRIHETNYPQNNYFEELAKESNHGLLAVAGNDDLPQQTNAICGNNVFNLYSKPVVFGDYLFIGIEGSTTPPGSLLHTEKEVQGKLNYALQKNPGKKIIIVSHTPPYEVLDMGLRFGINNIGSKSLRKFIDKNHSIIRLVICGHAHSQGGNEEVHKGVTIINCASHDNEGEPGKLCHINLSDDIETKWDLLFESVYEQELNELMKIPLVARSRAEALHDMGIRNIDQLTRIENILDIKKYPCFNGPVIDLIKNYAEAIKLGKPIVMGRPRFFDDTTNHYFFDAEYDPSVTETEQYGIFLLGLMSTTGKVKQWFLDDPRHEKEMLVEFSHWLTMEKPVLVGYSTISADKPQLMKAFRRFNISTSVLEKSFFDLYNECIFTQSPKKQLIFLPMSSKNLKDISALLGYNEPVSIEISDGAGALLAYKKYLDKRNEKLKNELLKYNKRDLDQTKYIYNRLNSLTAKTDDG